MSLRGGKKYDEVGLGFHTVASINSDWTDLRHLPVPTIVMVATVSSGGLAGPEECTGLRERRSVPT